MDNPFPGSQPRNFLPDKSRRGRRFRVWFAPPTSSQISGTCRRPPPPLLVYLPKSACVCAGRSVPASCASCGRNKIREFPPACLGFLGEIHAPFVTSCHLFFARFAWFSWVLAGGFAPFRTGFLRKIRLRNHLSSCGRLCFCSVVGAWDKSFRPSGGFLRELGFDTTMPSIITK